VVRNLLEQTQEAFDPHKIAQARQTLLEVATHLRSLLFEMRPPAWEQSDLKDVLKDYALTFEERHGLPVAFEIRGDGEDVPEPVRVALFRILQESLHNAWKHAQAEQARVELELRLEHVRLEVRDDGVGFDVPKYLGGLIDQGRLGLAGMRERAEEVGGTCVIESGPDQGTRVSVRIPYGCRED